VATTHSYVNPVIAVILGVIILKENLSAWTLAGASLVVLGVAGVFRDRRVSYRRIVSYGPGRREGG
jgi:drug/metabolite transporter (DMT)-like permease